MDTVHWICHNDGNNTAPDLQYGELHQILCASIPTFGTCVPLGSFFVGFRMAICIHWYGLVLSFVQCILLCILSYWWGCVNNFKDNSGGQQFHQ